jgi:hypothetical protein
VNVRELVETRSARHLSDDSAKKARLIRVMDEMIDELQRQGVAEVLSNLNFDPKAMAEVMIKAADGEVVPFPGVRQNR